MRMLRWVRDKTKKDTIRSEVIANYLEVAPIEDKIRKNYLKLRMQQSRASCSKEKYQCSNNL